MWLRPHRWRRGRVIKPRAPAFNAANQSSTGDRQAVRAVIRNAPAEHLRRLGNSLAARGPNIQRAQRPGATLDPAVPVPVAPERVPASELVLALADHPVLVASAARRVQVLVALLLRERHLVPRARLPEAVVDARSIQRPRKAR